jgi:hypothetical protein
MMTRDSRRLFRIHLIEPFYFSIHFQTPCWQSCSNCPTCTSL